MTPYSALFFFPYLIIYYVHKRHTQHTLNEFFRWCLLADNFDCNLVDFVSETVPIVPVLVTLHSITTETGYTTASREIMIGCVKASAAGVNKKVCIWQVT